MSDFVAYAPSVRSVTSGAAVEIKAATPVDAHHLAAVLAARGGTLEEHLHAATRLIERLTVLLMAEKDGAAVGWCGIQKYQIFPDAVPEWLVAGLTVVPEQRRQGIAVQLLQAVLRATADSAPREPIFSIINARNLASIDLHKGLGFAEVARGSTFAGINFTGGEGVLLRLPSVT